MGLLDRLFGARDAHAEPRGIRTKGLPTSSNRASSMHLRWDLGPARVELVEVAATLTIVEPPVVPRLYFWALQASFASGNRHEGAGHVGLQWHPGHPGSTAVNWGGYAAGGGELAGSASAFPSAMGNANTRDFVWEPGRPYRLGIRRGGAGWEGLVDGVVVRSLRATGDRLTDSICWSEVFAACDDPSVTVRWSDLAAVTADGRSVQPRAVTLSYQEWERGGCTNTSSELDGDGGVVQRTNTERRLSHGTVVPMTEP